MQKQYDHPIHRNSLRESSTDEGIRFIPHCIRKATNGHMYRKLATRECTQIHYMVMASLAEDDWRNAMERAHRLVKSFSDHTRIAN